MRITKGLQSISTLLSFSCAPARAQLENKYVTTSVCCRVKPNPHPHSPRCLVPQGSWIASMSCSPFMRAYFSSFGPSCMKPRSAAAYSRASGTRTQCTSMCARVCVTVCACVRACVRACVLQGYSCRVRQYSECMVRASDNETDPSCIREHHTLAHTHRYTALSTSLVVTTCVVLLSPAIDMMQFSNTDRFGPEYFAAG